jgi:hypothetical protein
MATVTCLLVFFELLKAPDRVLALLAVLLWLAMSMTEELELYCHVFLVGVALGVSMHMHVRMRTHCIHASAVYILQEIGIFACL